MYSVNGFTFSKAQITECFIDLGKLNLLKISLSWSKSVKQSLEGFFLRLVF